MLLHTGGIAEAITIPRERLAGAIDRLTTCTEHGASHVFVVDQSHGDYINLGVSVHGAACLNSYLYPDG